MRSSLKFGNVDEGIPAAVGGRSRRSRVSSKKNTRFRGNSSLRGPRTRARTRARPKRPDGMFTIGRTNAILYIVMHHKQRRGNLSGGGHGAIRRDRHPRRDIRTCIQVIIHAWIGRTGTRHTVPRLRSFQEEVQRTTNTVRNKP
jgi:hypothetical protein